jgi:hypothetical protein
MTTAAVHRPVGVTVIAIIAFVQAILNILAGLGLIIERNDADLRAHVDVSSGTLTTYGLLAIIWGAVALFVAFGLWNGANWARILVAVLEFLVIAGGVWLLFAWSGTYLWQGIWQILIGLVVLYLLYNARAEEFFEQRRPA